MPTYVDAVKRITASLGYSGTFTGCDTLFLNPRILGGTLAFNYQKTLYGSHNQSIQGLSYKTTWNYYGYNLKTPVNMPGLQQSVRDFNGSKQRSQRAIHF